MGGAGAAGSDYQIAIRVRPCSVLVFWLGLECTRRAVLAGVGVY
jgi:hypothetical protein